MGRPVLVSSIGATVAELDETPTALRHVSQLVFTAAIAFAVSAELSWSDPGEVLAGGVPEVLFSALSLPPLHAAANTRRTAVSDNQRVIVRNLIQPILTGPRGVARTPLVQWGASAEYKPGGSLWRTL